MNGLVIAVNVSSGGLPKTSVPEAKVTVDGLVGDGHHDTKHHGGSDQAVCLYSVELYHDLITERILVKPGDFGENLTTSGIDYRALHVGDRMRVGEGCLLEITKVRVPCYKLTKFDERLPKAILGRSGWMARVRTEGVVRAGDSIDVLPAAVAEE